MEYFFISNHKFECINLLTIFRGEGEGEGEECRQCGLVIIGVWT